MNNLDLNYRFNNKIIDINECNKLINNNYKNLIGRGGQGSVFKLSSNKCGLAVVKIFHKTTANKEIERETYFLKKVKNIIEKDICPNFIYLLNTNKDNKLIMEYANGDLISFLKITEHSDEIFENMIFQILIAILVMQKKIQMFHNDLKPKNIFYLSIDNSKYKYFKYIINDQVFYLPNIGYLFVIGDFGHSEILEKNNFNTMSNDDIKFAIDYNYDFEYISSFYNRIIIDNIIKLFNDYEDFLNKNNLTTDSNLREYIDNKINDLEIHFKKYSDKLKKSMLLRAVIYYCLENNLFDWRKYKENFIEFLPSENINILLKNVFLSKEPIESLLNKYFDKFKSISINDQVLIQNNVNKIKEFNINFKSNNFILKRENFNQIINFIKNNYKIDKFNYANTKYYYTSFNNFLPKFIKPMYIGIKTFDYLKPIILLNEKYNNSYYTKLINTFDKLMFKDRLDLYKTNTNLEEIDLDEMMLQYIKSSENTFIITLWPNLNNFYKEIIKYLEDYGTIYYYKKINLTYRGLINFICSIYDEFENKDILNIALKKVEYFKIKKNQDTEISIIIFDNSNNMLISGQGSRFKKQLRNWCMELLKNNFIDMTDIRGNDLVHINDYFYQTIEYSQILLNSNSINLLNNRLYENIYNKFYNETFLKVETYRKFIYSNFNLEVINSTLILGGILLYFYGLRNANDIDGICINYTEEYNYLEKMIKGFSESKTKINFIDFGITNSKYWRESWDTLNQTIGDYFDITDYKEMCFNPKFHCYFKGIKMYLVEYEIYRKIIRLNKKIDKKEYATLSKDLADIIIILNLNDKLFNNFIYLKNNKITFDKKIIDLYSNLKNIPFDTNIENLIWDMINKNYPKNIFNNLKKTDLKNYF